MTSLECWLDSAGVGHYAAAFEKHGIDWDVLPQLNDGLLKDVEGDRRR